MSSTFASYTISPKYTNIFGHFELSNTWDSIVLLQTLNYIHPTVVTVHTNVLIWNLKKLITHTKIKLYF